VGALVEITHVVLDRPDQLREAFVDLPRRGTTVEARGADVVGWVLGADTEPIAVELSMADRTIGRLAVGEHRSDLAEAFPGVPGADRAGFRGVIALLGPQAEPRVEVHAVLADDRRVRVAVISGRRHWRRSSAECERDLVSVVVPCHRQAHHLPDALASLLAQTYPHVEIVVVDDGSPDNSGEVARRRPGVRVVRQEQEGLAGARNTGIRHTNGDYLVFLDADDQLLPDALQTGVDHLRAHPEAAFASGHYRHVAADGSELPTPRQRRIEGDHYAALLRHNIAGMPGTVMFRRAVFEHVRGFDGSVPGCEDYELYLRVARDFPVSCHNQVTGLYRRYAGGMSSDAEAMLRSSLMALRRQRRYVRGSRPLEGAYREGEAFWTRYYGEPVRERVALATEEGDWPRAARGLLTLAGQEARSRIFAIRARGRRA
jgi:glycosyltransferase involved in cell wall biosynthesis